MPVVAIYNNKGGEGKSTVTVGLAEFLSGNRDKRVLVVDVDAQASSSCALLGHETLNAAVAERRTIVDLVAELRSRRRLENLDRYLVWRPGTEARGSALGEIAVLVPDGTRMFDLEESMNWRRDHSLLRRFLKPMLDEFDFVVIDMPGNLTRASVVSLNGLVMSDFVLIPVHPSRMSLNGLPPTFDMIDFARTKAGDGHPAVIGLLRNETDRRREQYRSNFPAIEKAVGAGDLPPLFDSLWPPSPALESATDENRNSQTLKERFGNSYDHARKVARELERRCAAFEASRPARPVKRTIWQKLGLA